MFNPVHYRKTYPAIGNTTDQMATTVVGPESAISLLKGIYASLGGGVPLPDGSVGLEKLQFISGHRVLGRAKPFSGFVEQITFSGQHFDWALNPGPGGVDEIILKKLSITTDYVADSTINNQKVVDHSIDIRTKAAGVTPIRLFGSDPGGLVEMVLVGPGLRLRVPDIPPLVLEIAPSGITEDFIQTGAIINGHIADLQIDNRTIRNDTIDLIAKAAAGTPSRLVGTNSTTGDYQFVTIGSGLSYVGGVLAATAGGTGSVNTVLPVDNFSLARFSDGTGTSIEKCAIGPGLLLTPTGASSQLMIQGGGVTGSMIAAGAILDTHVASATLDATRVFTPTQENKLLGTFTATGHWGLITIGAGLNLFAGVLTGSGVVTSGAVTSSMLTGYADSSGATLRGINLPPEGIGLVGANLVLTNDLASLEAAITNNAIYYRSAADTWSPVNITQGLTLSGGTLGIVHPTLVSVMNTPAGQIAADKVPYYTSAIGGTAQNTFTATSFARGLMANADAATFRAGIGAQPLDADLTSIAAASAVNSLYYRSATDTWAPVTIGTNLTFSGGTLSATGTGSVNTGGGVTSAQLAGYADATGNLIQGITLPTAGFTRSGAALILTNDLASLEAASGTNTIYYRSAADTWSPVTIGSGLSFSGGTLTGTGGAGDVTLAGTNPFTGLNTFSNANTVFGNNAVPSGSTGGVHVANQAVTFGLWNTGAANFPRLNFLRSNNNTIGTGGAPATNFELGRIVWRTYRADNATVQDAAVMGAIMENAPSGAFTLASIFFEGMSPGARRMTIHSSGVVFVGVQKAPFGGQSGWLSVDGTSSNAASITVTNHSAAAAPPQILMRHHRGAIDTHGATIANDLLGRIEFYGNDGTQFVQGAKIEVNAETVPSSGFVDASMRFFTFKAGQGYTEKLRIWPSGGISANQYVSDPGLGSINASTFNVKQAADSVGAGFYFNNAAGDCNAYQFLGGTANPNSPRDVCIVPNYPGTGLTVWNAGDLTKIIAGFRPAGCILLGVNDGSSAAAGYVGEYFTPNTFINLTVAANTSQVLGSLNGLTAGDWDVWVVGYAASATGTQTYFSLGINDAAITLPTPGTIFQHCQPGISTSFTAYARFTKSGTFNAYVNVNTGSTSGVQFNGTVYARRRR